MTRTMYVCWITLVLWSAGSALCYGQLRWTAKLPADTRLCIAVSDVSRLSERWNATSLSDMLQRPEFSDFRRQLTAAATSGSRPLLTSLDWSDVVQLATGPLMFAIVGEGGHSMVALTTDQTVAALAQIEKLTNEYRAQGATIENEELHGHAVTVAKLAAPPEGQSGQRWLTYAAGVLYLTNDRELLIRMLQSSPATNAVGQLAWFRAITRRGNEDLPEGHLSWWMQGDALEWLVSQEAVFASSGAPASSLATFRTARSQGFDAIEAIGGTVAVGERGQEMIAETYVYRDGPLLKAAKMLSTINRPLDTTTKWNLLQFSRITHWNLDWAVAIGGYGSWFDATYGEGEDGVFELILDEIRDEPDAPGVDIRGEILSLLGGHLATCQFSDAALGENVRIYAVPISDASRVGVAIGQLLRGDPDVTRKTIHGHTIWQYGDLQRNSDEPILGPDLSGWAITIIDSHLLLANDIRAIELVSRGESTDRTSQKAIADNARQSANAESDLCGWQFARLPDALRPSWRSLRSGNAQHSVVGRVAARLMRDGNANATLDFNTLPPVTSLDFVSGSSTSVIRNVSDGWRVTTTVQLAPEQDVTR